MMKNKPTNRFWKKTTIVLVIIIFGLMFNDQVQTNVVQAQANNSGSGQQLFCARDFSNFLTTGLDFDGEGFIDYWRDILVIYNTNYCQYTDIDSMLNRIDQARKQIRQAFYVCDKVTSEKVTAQYNQMSAELYYLRHFVDTKESPNPKASQAEKDQTVQPNPSVHDLFMNMFVKKLKYFDTQTAETVFLQIQEKYKSKVEEYKNCSDPNFTALKEKVTNLINTIETIKKLGQKFAEQVQQRWSAMEKRVAASNGIWSAFSADSLGDFFSRVVGTRVNGEPLSETTVWEQISNTAKQNTPGVTGGSAAGANTGNNLGQTAKPLPAAITYDSVVQDMKNIKQRDEDANLDVQYVSEYDLKYRQVSSSALDKMKASLDTLKQTVDNTFDPLDQVRTCVSDVVGKQCSGK